jgi:hypothetical protein
MFEKKGDVLLMKKKKKMIGLVLGLFLVVPGMVFANGTMPDPNNKGVNNTENSLDQRNHHMMDKNWQEKMKQKQQKLLSFVNKYTPEKKKEWEAVIKDRNSIMEKWQSPEFAEKRQQWKKEKMAKFEGLHKQYEEGKITKEEFVKKVHGSKETGHWKIYHELKDSVKSNNDKKTAQLLNQLLTHYKQQNEMMKAAMQS